MTQYRRIELHNHTIESDGDMTVPELVDYLVANDITCFALTDHNTTSGLPQLDSYIQEQQLPLAYVEGFELTSYYGHLLCLNINKPIPWDDIDPLNGDILFHRVQQQGGLIGIAHPFSMRAPISNGVRFLLKLHDYNCIDFIEVINNAHPMKTTNMPAILWWESLVFDGYHIAATSGMDLHRPRDLSGTFKTYLFEEDHEIPIAITLRNSIKNSKTLITKGPLFTAHLGTNQLYLNLPDATLLRPMAVIKTKEREQIVPLPPHAAITPVAFQPMVGEKAIVVELYDHTINPDTLVALAAPIYL